MACHGKQRQWLWSVHGLSWGSPQVDSHVDLLQVAKETDGFSGSDLKEMCRDAALLCVREYVNNTCPEHLYVGPLHSQPCPVPACSWHRGQGTHSTGLLLSCYTQPPSPHQFLLLLSAPEISAAPWLFPSWRWPEPPSAAAALVNARHQCC